MSEESGAGPPDSGDQDQNLEGVSILTWSTDDVQAWLKGEDFWDCTAHLVKLNGKKLAAAKEESFRQKFGKDPFGRASDLFEAVEVILRKQNRNRFLSDEDFNDIMATRGTPVQSGSDGLVADIHNESSTQETPPTSAKIEMHQDSASSMAASNCKKMLSVGMNFSIRWQWFVDSSPILAREVEDKVISNKADILRKFMLEHFDITQVSETTKGRTDVRLFTQGGHMDKIGGTIREFESSTNDQSFTMETLGCPEGVATRLSKPDGWIRNKTTQRLRCIWEVTHGTSTPAESLRQGYAEATNVALSLLKAGVAVSNICVPIISSNGRLFQFAEVLMLEPALPYLRVISKVLDTANEKDRNIAAKIILQIEAYCQTQLEAPASAEGASLQYPTPKHPSYYLKDIQKYFFKVYDWSIDASLLHMFHILEHLYKDENAKNFVLHPLTILTSHESNDQLGDQLVFPFLRGYQIGLPKKKETREKFMETVKKAMDSIHKAGVIHMDFYPSNLMWWETDGGVDLKVIDWDAAHFTGEMFTQNVQNHMNNGDKHVKQQHLCASNIYDEYFYNVMSHFKDSEDLQASSKNELDSAFTRCCQQFAQLKHVDTDVNTLTHRMDDASL